MTPEALDDLLHVWGRAYGETPPAEWDEGEGTSRGSHPIGVAMAFAPGRRSEVIRSRTTMGRDGYSRRKLMAGGLVDCGLRIVPTSFVDPVPGTRSTNSGSGTPPLGGALESLVEQVQSAWLVLHRLEEQQADVLRMEYQVRAMTQREKATELGLTFGNYRLMLATGRAFIRGKIAK